MYERATRAVCCSRASHEMLSMQRAACSAHYIEHSVGERARQCESASAGSESHAGKRLASIRQAETHDRLERGFRQSC